MRVLLVEDDYAISQSIETMLKKEGINDIFSSPFLLNSFC